MDADDHTNQRPTDGPKEAARTFGGGRDTDGVDQRLGALWRAARLGPNVDRLRRHVLQAGHGSIEPGQFRTLDTVVGYGPCPVRELALVMGVEPSTVTRATRKLVDAGLIDKRRAPRDHREVLVEATEAGLKAHRYYVGRAEAIYRSIFAEFDLDERTQLAELLERMLKSTDAVLASVEQDRRDSPHHRPEAGTP
ncbi:MAG: MarR family winged helix-turn-helix transcriptional regulator [Acidimicrobiales bacterium]